MSADLDPLARLEDLDARLREDASGEDEEAIPARQLTRLLDVARAMTRTHDRDRLLSYVNERLRELFDAQNAFVVLFDEVGRPVIQAAHGDETPGGACAVSATLLDRVRTGREPVVIDDVTEDDDLRDQSSIARLRIASVLCAPLIVEDEVIGVLQFDQRGEPNPFPRSDLRLLTLFADQVASALHNLRLIEQKADALREVREAQERLVQAERLSALGEMAAGIAHNFNNTLFVALGLSDVLLARDDLHPEAHGAVTRIRVCALDAANTVRRLQSFARGGDDGEEERASCSLEDIVREAAEMTRHKWHDEARSRGVTIDFRTRVAPTPPVRGRAAVVREVLTNLVFNAVDALERDGTIEVGVDRAADGRVRLTVRDDGVGMDAETQRLVFDPFFTTKGPRGHGFGLSTCWSITRRLGGEIAVASAPGRGSVFTVLLPVAVERGAELEELPRDPGRRLDVLLIDDDDDVVEVTRELLEMLGHRVVGETDPDRALERVASGEFDVVLSDVGMPGGGGSDVVRAVRHLAPELPIVLLTGWGVDVELDDDVAARVAGVLGKPVTSGELAAALASAVGPAGDESGAER